MLWATPSASEKETKVSGHRLCRQTKMLGQFGWDAVRSALPWTQIHGNHCRCQGPMPSGPKIWLLSALLRRHTVSQRQGKSAMTYHLLTAKMVQSIKERKGQGSHQPEPVQNKRALQIQLSDIWATTPGSAAPVHSTCVSHFENNNEDLLLVTRHMKIPTRLSSILREHGIFWDLKIHASNPSQ